jgi:drug/metabolite transporter (DMT)-like permease
VNFYRNKAVLLVLLGVIWGSGYSIARYCVTHGVPSLGYSFWQSLGPAIVLTFCTLLFFIRRHPSMLCLPSSVFRLLAYFLLCGLIGIAIPNTTMYFGAAHLPSSLLTILVNTAPLFIYPMALLSRQEHFRPLQFVVLAVGILGMLLMIIQHNTLPKLYSIPWTLLVLLTPVCFAFCDLLVNPLKPEGLPPLTAAAGMLFASSLILLPFLLSLHAFYPLHLNFLSSLIVLEIVLSSVGYILFFKLIYLAGPVYYSLVGGVVALTGILWGLIIFHETWTWADTLGTFCILSAILLLR